MVNGAQKGSKYLNEENKDDLEKLSPGRGPVVKSPSHKQDFDDIRKGEGKPQNLKQQIEID
jgi:hypothetical protein